MNITDDLADGQPQDTCEDAACQPDQGWLRVGMRLLIHPASILFLSALAVRLVVAGFVITRFSGSLVLDDLTYWALAGDLAENTTSSWDEYESGLYASTRAFTLPMAFLYGLFGPSSFAGQAFVALIAAISVVLVYLISREILRGYVALVPPLVVAFLPSQVLWSSLVLKDAFVWTILISIALIFARLARSRSVEGLLGWLALLVVATTMLAFLRAHTLVVACLALALGSWVGISRFRWFRVAALVLLLIFLPWVRGLGPAGWAVITRAETITEIQQGFATGAASAIVDPHRATFPSLEVAPLEELPPDARASVKKVRELKEREDVLSQRLQEARTRQRQAVIRQRLDAVRTRILEEVAVAEQIVLEEQPENASRSVGPRHIIRGLSVMLLEPYPWDAATSSSFRMSQAEMVVWYPILIFAAIGLFAAFRWLTFVLFPLLVGGGTLIVYALAEGNVGSAFRHRSEFVWVIALLAGLGVQRLAGWRAGE